MEGNIKIELVEIDLECVDCVCLPQDKDQLQAL
jgi:hypothetical protein